MSFDESEFNYSDETASPPVEKSSVKDYAYFPVRYPELEVFYQKQKSAFWTPQEIDYSRDRTHWDSLDDDSKHFLKFVLSFFAQFDGIINENLIDNFKNETRMYKEAASFYAAQEFFETMHNETYSILIETFFRDAKEKKKAFNAIENYDSIKNMADWVFEWMDSEKPIIERVVAFACVEGIFFSACFCAIYWIKKKNILHGLTKANEFIARDEALHTQFAVALYHTMKNDGYTLQTKRGKEIIRSAVDRLVDFVQESLKVELIGMTSDAMIKYVKSVANTLSVDFGFGEVYEDVVSPFIWMVTMVLPNKTNFHESRVSEYTKPANTGNLETEKSGVIFDYNF